MAETQTATLENSNLNELDKTLKVGHLVISILFLLGAIVGIYVNNEKGNASRDERIKNLEIQYNKIDTKSDKILDKIELLTVLVTNKQDRKP